MTNPAQTMLEPELLEAELRLRKFTYDGVDSGRARQDILKLMTALRAAASAPAQGAGVGDNSPNRRRVSEVETVGWAILQALHEGAEEGPQSWSDLAEDQEKHIKKAAVAAIEAVTDLSQYTAQDFSWPAQGVGEPVAWRWRFKNPNYKWIYSDDCPEIASYSPERMDREPLYAAPASQDASREALEPFAKIANDYDAAHAMRVRHHTDEGRAPGPPRDQAFAKADAILALTPSHEVGTQDEDQQNTFADMLWKWFEDESRIGADGMRPERLEGLSADDFKTMLDEHEAALLPAHEAGTQEAGGDGTKLNPYVLPFHVDGGCIRDANNGYVAELSSPHGGEARDRIAQFIVTAVNLRMAGSQEPVAWQQTLSELRDYLADIVGGAALTKHAINNAKELIAESDALLTSIPPEKEGT